MTLTPILIMLLAIVWVSVIAFARVRRRWLVWYFGGAFGLVLLVVAIANISAIDAWVESVEAAQTAALASLLGIGVKVMGGSGLAIENHVGWAVFDIGIECSAILEMSAIVGLTVFYPAFGPLRRTWTAALGWTLVYVANILRILLIIAIINAYGTEWVFAAHAVFGRVFFFLATIGIYWYLMTRPTVGAANLRVKEVAGE